METLRIETYSKIYQREVSELIISIQRNEFHVPITLDDQPDLKSIETFYQSGKGNFWIALQNENVVGTIALIDIGKDQVALRKMFVRSAYRGAPFNTGQQLMDVVFAWCRQKRIRQIILGTLERFIAAQKFYRRNGFIEVQKEQLPQNFPRMALDNMFFAKSIDVDTEIEIHEYRPEHQPCFEKLNRDWIEKYFWMEPLDFQVLQHPDVHIIGKGGTILMAYSGKEIAGTVALKFVQDGVYEFTKMAVDERFQGKKIGQALADAAIIKAKTLGAQKIILYSNTKLKPAINLYRKIGFQEVAVDGPYKRSDIKMELTLNKIVL